MAVVLLPRSRYLIEALIRNHEIALLTTSKQGNGKRAINILPRSLISAKQFQDRHHGATPLKPYQQDDSKTAIMALPR